MAERLGEFERIDRYLRPLAADVPGALQLRDDAAIVDVPADRRLVVTTDTMVETVHWLPGTDPAGIAAKLLRVNLSDLAAMGAVPFGYTLNLALPRAGDGDPRTGPATSAPEWLDAFTAGLAAEQRVWSIGLLGGDSVGTPGPAALTATLFGLVERGHAHLRLGARPGDRIWVSGTPGDGALGLQAARGDLDGVDGIDDDARAHLAGRYHRPTPRVALGRALIGLATAAIDLSDGLPGDLGHLCRSSGVAAAVEADAIPLSAAARAAVAARPDLYATALSGGDDYELLFTAPPDRDAAIRAAGEASDTAVTPIGEIGPATDAPPVEIRAPDGRPIPDLAGWTHA
ncbi:MAG: thiamine-phosphate kinase [Alphaproteobacteria bacterium]|jgi:thiamine-monophosphate kinase|nr:thiamine-phosphate kinase [Alphaproteobacteria bacterium]